MNELRTAFLGTGASAVELVASPRVAAVWLGPSTLDGWDVTTLCGHIARGMTTVSDYLGRDAPPVDTTRVGPVEYFVGAIAAIAGDERVAAGIAERGEAAAAGGQAGVVDEMERSLDHLAEDLDHEPPQRTVSVFGGVAMTLDDYLVTRMIELCVHCDDLVASTGAEAPRMPDLTCELVAHTLVDVARRRHGEVAVLRALARSERASEPASAFA